LIPALKIKNQDSIPLSAKEYVNEISLFRGHIAIKIEVFEKLLVTAL
jgi:hypothetical protein